MSLRSIVSGAKNIAAITTLTAASLVGIDANAQVANPINAQKQAENQTEQVLQGMYDIVNDNKRTAVKPVELATFPRYLLRDGKLLLEAHTQEQSELIEQINSLEDACDVNTPMLIVDTSDKQINEITVHYHHKSGKTEVYSATIAGTESTFHLNGIPVGHAKIHDENGEIKPVGPDTRIEIFLSGKNERIHPKAAYNAHAVLHDGLAGITINSNDILAAEGGQDGFAPGYIAITELSDCCEDKVAASAILEIFAHDMVPADRFDKLARENSRLNRYITKSTNTTNVTNTTTTNVTNTTNTSQDEKSGSEDRKPSLRKPLFGDVGFSLELAAGYETLLNGTIEQKAGDKQKTIPISASGIPGQARIAATGKNIQAYLEAEKLFEGEQNDEYANPLKQDLERTSFDAEAFLKPGPFMAGVKAEHVHTENKPEAISTDHEFKYISAQAGLEFDAGPARIQASAGPSWASYIRQADRQLAPEYGGPTSGFAAQVDALVDLGSVDFEVQTSLNKHRMQSPYHVDITNGNDLDGEFTNDEMRFSLDADMGIKLGKNTSLNLGLEYSSITQKQRFDDNYKDSGFTYKRKRLMPMAGLKIDF